MPIIITITNEPGMVAPASHDYTYYDRILKNVWKREYEVFYSGQNKGRNDNELTKAVNNNELFKVYYREKKNVAFIYLGSTYSSNIIQGRTLPINVDTNTDQRLQIHLIINNIENIPVPIYTISGPGRYKKDVF